jgi:uncharacterized tellurite resistance protein B-like protein
MNLLKLLGIAPEKGQDFGQLFEKISTMGQALSESELKQATATAGLCGRIAYADAVITEDELERMTSILRAESKLSPQSVDIVTTLLVDHRVELLTLEEYFYSRLANESMTEDEKRALLKNLFLIAAADGTICLEEENALFTIASQLRLPRQTVIELKREFKRFLSVFQTQAESLTARSRHKQ